MFSKGESCIRLTGFVRCFFVRCVTCATVAASGLLLSACATMFGSDHQTITINPSGEAGNGAQVVVYTSTGTRRVQLPTLIAPRLGSERVIVRLQDDRFHPAEVQLERSVRGVYWVNILFYPGLLIDWMTGAMWKYEDEVVVTTQVRSVPRSSPPQVEPSSPSSNLIPARVSSGRSGSGSSRR